MWNWLAKKLYEHLIPCLVPAIKQGLFELDKNKHYLLFLPNSMLDNMTVEELRQEVQPFVGEINLMMMLTDEFHIVEF